VKKGGVLSKRRPDVLNSQSKKWGPRGMDTTRHHPSRGHAFRGKPVEKITGPCGREEVLFVKEGGSTHVQENKRCITRRHEKEAPLVKRIAAKKKAS